MMSGGRLAALVPLPAKCRCSIAISSMSTLYVQISLHPLKAHGTKNSHSCLFMPATGQQMAIHAPASADNVQCPSHTAHMASHLLLQICTAQ